MDWFWFKIGEVELECETIEDAMILLDVCAKNSIEYSHVTPEDFKKEPYWHVKHDVLQISKYCLEEDDICSAWTVSNYIAEHSNCDEATSDIKCMFCKCGCGNGVIIKVDRDEDDKSVSLQLVSDLFYNGAYGNIKVLKEKLKRIWYILAGKEYCYFDLNIEDGDVQTFKEFVSKI